MATEKKAVIAKVISEKKPAAKKISVAKAPQAKKVTKTTTANVDGTVKVTLVRSVIGRIEAHKASVRGLGLRRMHQTVELQDTPAVRGMINAVGYLLKVEA
ncbi:MAG: 50S ribosomal protein L30 [Methylophilaceae bacterium]|nr:50S ribosomal protein L30 [Methylophilaceae bacterium]